MNTQLKKGDRCQSPYGVATIQSTGGYVTTAMLADGRELLFDTTKLTRIPTHAERMQKIVDAAFDAENRLTDDETVQFRVGDMAEFVRHYLVMRGLLEAGITRTEEQIAEAAEFNGRRKKILKGEL